MHSTIRFHYMWKVSSCDDDYPPRVVCVVRASASRRSLTIRSSSAGVAVLIRPSRWLPSRVALRRRSAICTRPRSCDRLSRPCILKEFSQLHNLFPFAFRRTLIGLYLELKILLEIQILTACTHLILQRSRIDVVTVSDKMPVWLSLECYTITNYIIKI